MKLRLPNYSACGADWQSALPELVSSRKRRPSLGSIGASSKSFPVQIDGGESCLMPFIKIRQKGCRNDSSVMLIIQHLQSFLLRVTPNAAPHVFEWRGGRPQQAKQLLDCRRPKEVRRRFRLCEYPERRFQTGWLVRKDDVMSKAIIDIIN